MGRSTSVYCFCLAMDPIFVVLNQIPRVFVVAGYMDDTSIVGHQEDPTWVEEVFKYIRKWRTAGIVMDTRNCWQVGFSNQALTENTLYKVEDVWGHVHEEGQATCSAALQRVPSYARHFVLRHGDHCIQMPVRLFQDWHRRVIPALPVGGESFSVSIKDTVTHQRGIHLQPVVSS